MKKILTGTVAAIALVGVASPAAAQTDQRHYAGTGTINVPFFGPVTLSGTDTNPSNGTAWLYDTVLLPNGIGTRYTATASAPGNSETATPTVNVNFRLRGKVNKDCSFYSGNDASARVIDFGVIGVKTGNNENVQDAFEMVGPATATVETLTAGCNFNNEVTIKKDNPLGLINQNPGSYDNGQFQANIPYSVRADWTGVAIGAGATGGSGQHVAVSANDPDGMESEQQGAWRSDMTIKFNAPRVNNVGLVAGNYTGTTTLTLKAL